MPLTSHDCSSEVESCQKKAKGVCLPLVPILFDIMVSGFASDSIARRYRGFAEGMLRTSSGAITGRNFNWRGQETVGRRVIASLAGPECEDLG
jgi:hypothetical protein